MNDETSTYTYLHQVTDDLRRVSKKIARSVEKSGLLSSVAASDEPHFKIAMALLDQAAAHLQISATRKGY